MTGSASESEKIAPTDAYGLELRVLRVSMTTAAVMAVVGLGFAYAAGSQVILLDGLFNVLLFLMVALGLSVSKAINQGPDEAYHFGYGGYEPFLVLTRAGAGIILMTYAGFDAVQTILKGGTVPNGTLALIYSIILGTSCTLVALWIHRAYRRTGWPTMYSEFITWLMNGVLSAASGLALFGSGFLRGTALEWLVPYADPSIVIAMSLLILPIPLRLLGGSFLELMGRAPAEPTESRKALEALIPEGFSVRVVRSIRNGRTEYHALRLACDSTVTVKQCDEIRARWEEIRESRFASSWAVLVFSNQQYGV